MNQQWINDTSRQFNSHAVGSSQYEGFRVGFAHGVGRGSWVFDGNTDRESYRRVLAWIEDGDPRLDEVRPAHTPLAGEWADDFSLDQLAEATATPSGGEMAEVASAYEDGFYQGWEAEVVRACRYQLDG